MKKAGQLLRPSEFGTKWQLTEAYDLATLMQVCGLERYSTVGRLVSGIDASLCVTPLAEKGSLCEA